MTQNTQAVEAAVLETLPHFRRQDDHLLAGGASVMSENCHEIIHVDTLRKIIATVSAELARPLEEAPVGGDLLQQLLEICAERIQPQGMDYPRPKDGDEIADEIKALFAATPPAGPAGTDGSGT